MQLSPSYSIEFNILYSYLWSYIQGSVTIIAKKCHKSYNTLKKGYNKVLPCSFQSLDLFAQTSITF
jgi:hypothetical protein